VVGLARSDASARIVSAAGAAVHGGDLNDPESLVAPALDADGVIHLGFIHDFEHFAQSIETDLRAIETLGRALVGSGRPMVIAAGTAGIAPGRLATENIPFDPSAHPRTRNAAVAMGLGTRGVRVSFVRLAPTVHGKGDRHGFVRRLVDIAREKGVSAYIGDGTNRWNAVHRLDAAPLFRLAVEGAPAGAIYHAVGEEGIRTRDIAEAIGKKLGVPAQSISREAANGHFGWLGAFFAIDAPASSAITQEETGWKPTHPGLIEDLEAGYYTDD
jgi:nucleoside-diphosphate-sugar epimerase